MARGKCCTCLLAPHLIWCGVKQRVPGKFIRPLAEILVGGLFRKQYERGKRRHRWRPFSLTKQKESVIMKQYRMATDSRRAHFKTMDKKIFRKTYEILIGAIFAIAMFCAAQNIFAQGPPVLSSGSPMGIFANTAQAILSLNTDKNATCRYSTSPGLDYDLMSDTFSNTGQTYHSQQLTPADGKVYTFFVAYTYYVRCMDTAGNKSLNDYAIVFSIVRSSAPSDTAAPTRFNGRPNGTLSVDTSQAILSLNTDKNATCRYSTSPNTDYYSMANTFSITGQTSHYQNLDGLLNGKTYVFYVRCIDSDGHWNLDDFVIFFSTAQPSVVSDVAPPNRSGGQPTGTLPAGTNAATLFIATDENAHCQYSTTPGVSYASMTNNFSTTNQTTHSQTLSGLVGGQTYNYYVRCADSSGNANSFDYAISFSVASGASVPSGTPSQSSMGEPQVLGASTYNFGLDLVLVKTQANSDVYAIFEQTKRKIASRNVFDSYAEYWQARKINTVSPAELNSIPDATLIKTPNSPNVYILDKGFKRLLASTAIFNSYGLDWNKIVTINQTEIDSSASAPLIQRGVDLYRLDQNRVARYFPSMEILAENGYNAHDAVEVNDFEFGSYAKGIPMAS